MARTEKDWTGNSRSAHAILGARNYADHDREAHDYYATDPKAARLLMEVETFSPLIWECACGEGHLAKEFVAAGYHVYATDLIDRGYGYQQDFLQAVPPCPVSTSSQTRRMRKRKSLSNMRLMCWTTAIKWQCSLKYNFWRANVAGHCLTALHPKQSMSAQTA